MHQSGTNLENRTPTTFLKLPKAITNEMYFDAMGTITQCIATRFEQEDYEIYVNIN